MTSNRARLSIRGPARGSVGDWTGHVREQSLGQTRDPCALGGPLPLLPLPSPPALAIVTAREKRHLPVGSWAALHSVPGSAPLRGLLLLPSVSHPLGQGWALRTGTLRPCRSALQPDPRQRQAAAGPAAPLGSSWLSQRHTGDRGCPPRPGEPACGAAGRGRAEVRRGRTETRAAVAGSVLWPRPGSCPGALGALLAPGGFFVTDRLCSGIGTGNV